MNYFRTLWEDFKANRRGEKRTASRQIRGRVYEKKAPDTGQSPGGNASMKVNPQASCHIKVTRADGTVEHYDAPAQIEQPA